MVYNFFYYNPLLFFHNGFIFVLFQKMSIRYLHNDVIYSFKAVVEKRKTLQKDEKQLKDVPISI